MNAVEQFINQLEHKKRKVDAAILLPILEEASGYTADLQGKIICFGRYHYKYDSGREGDSSVTSFAPRKQQLVIYIMPGFSDYQHLMDKLGKFKTGSSCLYVNKLEDIDIEVLKQLVRESVAEMQRRYKCWAV